MTIARLPLAKEIDESDFDQTPVNETLVRELAGGAFLEQQRNVVLIGGAGTGKSHLAVAVARACIRNGARSRFFNVVDLVNKLGAEARADRQGRTADLLCRLDWFAIGLERMATRRLTPRRTRLPSLRTRPAGSCSSTSSAASTSAPRSSSPRTSRSANGPPSSATPR